MIVKLTFRRFALVPTRLYKVRLNIHSFFGNDNQFQSTHLYKVRPISVELIDLIFVKTLGLKR